MEAQEIGILPPPPGFRFRPTDEELVIHYLFNKMHTQPLPIPIPDEFIPEMKAIVLYNQPPDQIVSFSSGQREWYFFICEEEEDNHGVFGNCRKRIVGLNIGYWKKSGEDEHISSSNGDVLAMKTKLTYFSGKDPFAKRTHWKMDEYRIYRVDHNKIDGRCRLYTDDECFQIKHQKEEKWAVGKMTRGRDYESCY